MHVFKKLYVYVHEDEYISKGKHSNETGDKHVFNFLLDLVGRRK